MPLISGGGGLSGGTVNGDVRINGKLVVAGQDPAQKVLQVNAAPGQTAELVYALDANSVNVLALGKLGGLFVSSENAAGEAVLYLDASLLGATAPGLEVSRGSGADILATTSDGKVGAFGQAPAVQPTGVAVTAAAIHAALVSLGLITA